MLNYTVYRSKENKPWITFIHGAGGSSTIWFKQIKSFSKFFNLLLIDLRGHGKSKHHMLDLANSTYTFDAIAEDIIEVLEHEKIAKSHFMGISLGTILIRAIAEKSPCWSRGFCFLNRRIIRLRDTSHYKRCPKSGVSIR